MVGIISLKINFSFTWKLSSILTFPSNGMINEAEWTTFKPVALHLRALMFSVLSYVSFTTGT